MGCSSVHGVGPCLGIFDSISDGILDLCFVCVEPLFEREVMEKFLGNLIGILKENGRL